MIDNHEMKFFVDMSLPLLTLRSLADAEALAMAQYARQLEGYIIYQVSDFRVPFTTFRFENSQTFTVFALKYSKLAAAPDYVYPLNSDTSTLDALNALKGITEGTNKCKERAIEIDAKGWTG